MRMELQINRLVAGQKMVEIQEHETDNLSYLGTRFVFDWRWREQKWVRRARLVAKEFAHLDPTKPFLYAVQCGVKILPALMLSSQGQLCLHSCDVKDAYLQVRQEKPTYVSVQVDGNPYLCKLEYCLPGQRIGAKAWYLHLKSVLEKLELKPYGPTPAVFIRDTVDADGSRRPPFAVSTHVDDFQVLATEQDGQRLFELLESEGLVVEKQGPLQVGSTGECSFLKRSFSMQEDGMVVTMSKKYIESLKSLLEVPENRFKKVPTSTAYEKMPKDETPLDAEKARKYRAAVGILIYISPERADVQASVRLLGSWVTKPRWCDWMELKHLVQYLSFTCVYGQLLPVSGAGCSVLRPGDDDSLSCVDYGSLMQVFTDSNWAGCQETRKSVSCAHYWVNSILVYTQSKTQRSIALSSCEAEFLSAVSGCAEGLYLRRLVEKIVGLPTKLELRVDSSSARSLLMKSGFQRTRHIAAGVLWIQDRVAGGELEVKPVSSLKNTSDLGTKGHRWKRLMFLLFCIGMYDTERQSRVGIEQYEEQMQCVVNKGFLKAFRIHMIEHLGQEAKPSTAILNKIGKLVLFYRVCQAPWARLLVQIRATRV